jgi:hypothetical protein
VLDWVCVVGTGRLEKLLEVIGRLPRLVFEVTLSGGDELLIKIIRLLVIVSLITAGSNRDPLGSPLGPPLISFGAPLCTLAGCLEWCPSTAIGGQPPVALDENGPDCLLARRVPGGDVKQLLCGLWLIVAELMHEGPTVHAGPKCQDEVSVTDLGELMALMVKLLNVILEGLALLLLTTLQIPGVAWSYIRALKVASENLPEILLTINRVPGQLVLPGPGRVGQVDGEKLDDEEVVISPACPARKVVII